jgi:hypothetical protein
MLSIILTLFMGVRQFSASSLPTPKESFGPVYLPQAWQAGTFILSLSKDELTFLPHQKPLHRIF